MRWQNVHIFISSTFKDMHAERDFLIKRVFPRLADWCEERRLRLIDVDLRWGVPESATKSKRVLAVCLKRIDECRPYFLCFVGQRRGTVFGEDSVSPETLAEYPLLEARKMIGELSITEMEIMHALIAPLHGGEFVDDEGNARPVA